MKMRMLAVIMSIAVFAGMFSTTAFAAVEKNDETKLTQGEFIEGFLTAVNDAAAEEIAAIEDSENEDEDPAIGDPGFDEPDGDVPFYPGFPGDFPADVDMSLITKEFIYSIIVPTDASEKITTFANVAADYIYSSVESMSAACSAQTIDEYLRISIDANKEFIVKFENLCSEVKKLTTQEQLDYTAWLVDNIYEVINSLILPELPISGDDGIAIDDGEDYGDYDDVCNEPMTPEEIKKQMHDALYDYFFVQMVVMHDDTIDYINSMTEQYTHFLNLDGFAQSAKALYDIREELSKLYDETAYSYLMNAEENFYEQHEDFISSTIYNGFEDDYEPTPADYVEHYCSNIGDNLFELSLFVDKNYFRSENQGESLVKIKENLAEISDAVKSDIDGIITVTKVEKLASDVDAYIAAFEENGVTALNYGDVTSDEKVTASDVLQIRKSIAGQNVQFDTYAADVNVDGKVTASDVLMIRKYIAGQDIVFGPYYIEDGYAIYD